MNTIISAYEVVRNAPVKESFPTKYVCDHIYVNEFSLFEDCLGLDLYNALIADLKSISNIDEYDIQNTYNEGDEVVYDGCVFVSLNDNNTADPGNINYWKVRDKFNSECFQNLWDYHLKQLLSFAIILPAIGYATYQAGGNGLMEIINDNEKTVGYKAYDNFERKLNSDISIRKKAIVNYILNSKNKNCFEEFNLFKDSCKSNCDISAARRRLSFKY